ncbi:MAG: DUF2333 family protein [Alphaproteobacteria bacterium]|nr:DUF2333 family protein [Alphaproteobacteria bacterium]
MAHEIWLWIKEQVARFFGFLGRQIVRLWRYLLGWLSTVSGSTWRKVAIGMPVAFIVYILIGMPFAHRIDDSLEATPRTPAGGSQVVTTLAYLVKREAVDNNWTPNDPIFLPGWWIDNTPNFQTGLMTAVALFSFELRDQLGRMRGSSAKDDDLVLASDNLSKAPDRWVFDFSTSLLPITPTHTHYKDGWKRLEAYNARLLSGDAVFERRADNLQATISRIASDIGGASDALDEYIADNAGGMGIDFGADDLFYRVKGQMYAYHLILDALKHDFADVIADRELGPLYDALLESMRATAQLDPVMVSNGEASGVIPNHLSVQGFYLLRARTQLREIGDILLK